MQRSIYIVNEKVAVCVPLLGMVSSHPHYSVHRFASVDALLRCSAELEPGLALIACNMRGAGAAGVLEAICPLSGRFVVVMLTVDGAIHHSVDAMKAGAHDYIEMPCDAADLMACLDSGLAELERRCAEAAGRDAVLTSLALLSPRETQVLTGLASGCSNKQIAWTLQISPRTVEIYRANLMAKLGAGSLAEALRIVFAGEQAASAIEPPSPRRLAEQSSAQMHTH